MKPITLEWVAKAEGDWQGAQHMYGHRKHVQFETICFYTQQCVEKYLKARLAEAGQAISKTSNLSVLLKMVLPLEPDWAVLRAQIKGLKSYTWDITYPGRYATKAQAKQAIKDCREVRRVIRTAFGLPV